LNPPELLVVDDDPKITAMLRRALQAEGYEVRTANDGREGLARAKERQPDLVVLDLLMPEIDGLEVCRRLRDEGNVPILILTAKDETGDRVRGLDSGADDYLIKPFALDELLARIRALLRRREARDLHVLRFADLTLDLTTRIATRGTRAIELTTREFELLLYFLRHPKEVLSQQQLLDRVWEGQFDAESNVVHVYVGYLRSKLEAGGEPRLVHTVRGVGYVLRD
jgi:two-component system response regulator MprA